MTLSDWVHAYREARLREHHVTLRGERVLLRPMTEHDWDVLLRWNNDPDVLFFIGTEAIGLLVRLGFEQEGADAIFGCDIGDHNPRSLRAFEKNGFVLDATYAETPGSRRRAVHDLMLTRERYVCITDHEYPRSGHARPM